MKDWIEHVRIKAHPVVLMIQDTTELDYTSKNDISNLATLTYDTRKGLLLHPILAITPDRVSLGVIDAKFLRKNYEVNRTEKRHHYKVPIELKEINPPEHQQPIEWILLTSIPVHTLKQAITIIQWYCCRWQIEIYFRILRDYRISTKRLDY